MVVALLVKLIAWRNNIYKMYRFITISTWAKEAGVTRKAVYDRIARGTIKLSEYTEHPMIDTNDYAPCKKWNRNIDMPKVKDCPF